MKYFLMLVVLLLSLQVFSQQADTVFDGQRWKAPYSFAIPKDWGIERFIVPPSFAPSIPYQGVEDIRFTPGWANATSTDYWSYAFIWFLDGHQTMNAKTIQQNLTAYYTGLIKVNLDPAKKPVTGIPTTKVQVQKIKTAQGDVATFTAEIEMFDYMQLKLMRLHSKIHLKYYQQQDKTIVFYALSPQPFTATIWIALQQLWADFHYN